MTTFDPQCAGPTDRGADAPGSPAAVASLLALDPERLNELGPGKPLAAAHEPLRRLTPETLVAPAAVADRDAAQACLAGLWLYYDYLDESHRLSQDLDTPDGSFWHGILHRREPDPDNAKYWFRRVGRHPVFEPLRAAAAESTSAERSAGAAVDPRATFLTTQTAWEPYRWIDLCEAARLGQVGAATQRLCRLIQRREWELLFAHCYGKAEGK